MRWSAEDTLSWIIVHKPCKFRDWTPDMGREYERAQRELAAAVATERVCAWGRNEKEPHGPLEQVKADRFRLRDVNLVISIDGNMGALPPRKFSKYEGDRWRDIEFDAKE